MGIKTNKTKRHFTVLVVGDWAIDEYWASGAHFSAASSRTGKYHFKGLNSSDGATEQVCIAGLTAATIHRAKLFRKNPGTTISIIGLGVCHKKDEGYIRDLLHCASNRSKRSPFSVQPDRPPNKRLKNVQFINLATNYFLENKSKSDSGTTRIIRIFHNSGRKVELATRLDWDPKIDCREIDFNETKLDDKIKEALKAIDPEKQDIDAIVIKDAMKGVLSYNLIKYLADIYRKLNIPWYISSKEWDPIWLDRDLLSGLDIRLIMIPTVAADKAIRSKAITRWINPRGYATKRALRLIHDKFMMRSFNQYDSSNNDDIKEPNIPIVVVLPFGHRILAVGPANNEEGAHHKDLIVRQLESNLFKGTDYIETPFASVLFGALVTLDLARMPGEEIDINSDLRQSVSFTYEWMKSEVDRVYNPNSWVPKDDFEIFDHTKKYSSGIVEWRNSRTLSEAMENWGKATSGKGIVNNTKNGECIQLWRSMTEVDGYVCIVEKKRTALQRLFTELELFRKGHHAKSKSCMIIAPPGSGKTHLVEKLSEAIDYEYEPFNITRLTSRDELRSCFDKIADKMAKVKDKPVLVFIDEINAKLDGNEVWDAFLSPLEEGIFDRGYTTYKLNPCFWIFAGTGLPENEHGNKWSDFKSRLTMPFVDLYVDDKEKADTPYRLEMLYTAIAMISASKHITHISDGIIDLIMELAPFMGLRELSQFIGSIKYVENGIFSLSSLDENCLDLLSDKVTSLAQLKSSYLSRKIYSSTLRVATAASFLETIIEQTRNKKFFSDGSPRLVEQ